MINYIETHITDHCNLKCRGCSHFSGLVKEPYFKSLPEYIHEMEQLFKITNGYVSTIRIMGGEPLLHPQVIDFCTETRKIFPKASIVLVSNGILLNQFNNENINILNENNIELCISNYGIKINQEKLNKFKLHYFHEKNLMYNIGLDLNGSQDKDKAFDTCDHVHMGCNFLKNGRIYQCAISAQIDYFCDYFNTKIDYDLDDISIDIFSHTEKEILDFLSHPHDFCRYCDTYKREHSLMPFSISKGDITEWISQ